MDMLEEIGLLKMDFLGLRNLSILERIVKSIQRGGKRTFNLSTIPDRDEKTFELLSAGRTSGVFQLESDGMRNVLKRLKPNSFEDIVAVNALFRPGPMENIPMFIRRKHGEEAAGLSNSRFQTDPGNDVWGHRVSGADHADRFEDGRLFTRGSGPSEKGRIEEEEGSARSGEGAFCFRGIEEGIRRGRCHMML